MTRAVRWWIEVMHLPSARTTLGMLALATLLTLASCGSDDSASSQETAVGADATTTATTEPTVAPVEETTTPAQGETEEVDTETAESSTPAAAQPSAGCDDVAALFVTRGSANADLDDPQVEATCEGDSIVISSNGIPDYTYIGTSPGIPTDRGHVFTIPSSPTVADTFTDVPVIGVSGVTLGGIPIFGPTEGTGGDVDSLPGILSVCGSHNGPSGFHIHKILSSSETDCLFSPAEVAAAPQLVGYALDGFPIYTGIDQYTSSWELTDESLFATDTWAAHSYVEGSGDLDQCNGLTDADGNYAYYTTATFPYVMGCYVGEVTIGDAGGGGGDRPERPEGDEGGERPERPEGDEGGERPERPEPPADEADAEQP